MLSVPRLDHVPSYDEFLTKYLRLNQPCVLPFGLVERWPAFTQWGATNEGGVSTKMGSADEHYLHPTFARLAELYGHHAAPEVVEEGADWNATVQREDSTVSEAVDKMRQIKQTGEHTKVYIKDWHLVRQELQATEPRPTLPYTTPALFADDWMNNRRSEDEDDFRFCYAGMKGTRTGIHCDVYTSYSWSTNIVGRKRWRLFPPHVKAHLRKYPGKPTSELAESVDRMQEHQAAGQLGRVSDGKAGWPDWSTAMAVCHEVYQEPGETIFVPSGWTHEVENVTDCVSLNHNWCNSTNVVSMYRAMCDEVTQVEEALCDVREMLCDAAAKDDSNEWKREWHAIVQRVAQANAGWAWLGFWTMMEHSLAHPPCASNLRPSMDFVRQQCRFCVLAFLLREEIAFLDEETRSAAQRCSVLLDG